MAYGPRGAGDCAPGAPCPRGSYRRTRKYRDRTGTWCDQTSQVVPIGSPSTSTGASAGPSIDETSFASGTSATLRFSVLADRAAGDRERAVGDGHPRVQADLEQDLPDPLLGEAVAQGRLDVH